MFTFESQLNYLKWQEHLKRSALFRYWWQFWSNYSSLFFVIVFIKILDTVGLSDSFYKLMVLSAVSFLIARVIVVFTINQLVHRIRPYQKYDFTPITSKFFSFKTTVHNSFPSRHAAAFSSVAFIVLGMNYTLGLCLLGVTVMTGIARVILGYHYPTDIVAGLLVGRAVAYIAMILGSILLFT